MSYRQKANGAWVVEIYDPLTKTKRHVRAADFEMPTPRNERQCQRLERAALNARDARRPGHRDETCDSFATRWPDDFRRGKGGRRRSDSTTEHNRERVRRFGEEHAGQPLRLITRDEARAWALGHEGTVAALRAMFNDAVADGLADDNPFAKLGLASSKGRQEITVLTADEVDQLARIAERMHGAVWGPEVAAMILWAAYTCMRPGETAAARYSRLNGDMYELRTQFSSVLGRETPPKHQSTGEVYVPEPALRAVLSKPRRLGDDLIFRTKRGNQFRQESIHRAWAPVRDMFTLSLPATHHLRMRVDADDTDRLDFYELRHFGASYMLNQLELEPWVIAQQLRHSDGGSLVLKLYGHPDRRVAIDRIRRAYTGGAAASVRRGVAGQTSTISQGEA